VTGWIQRVRLEENPLAQTGEDLLVLDLGVDIESSSLSMMAA